MICRWLHNKCPSRHCPRWFYQYYFSSWYWSCTDDCMVNGDHRMLLWSPDQLPNGFLPGRRQYKVSTKMLRKIILVIIIQIWKMSIKVFFENCWFSLGIYQWILGSNWSTIVPWLLIVEVKTEMGFDMLFVPSLAPCWQWLPPGWFLQFEDLFKKGQTKTKMLLFS